MPPSKMHDGGASGKTKYCSCCGITACAGDQPNLNKGWANASWERKQEIIADHTYFEMGSRPGSEELGVCRSVSRPPRKKSMRS